MPDKIYNRNGPMWRRRIFIHGARGPVEGTLIGENMNQINVFSNSQESSNKKLKNVISRGRLRFQKSTDQGNPVTVLVYVPNKKNYPNQNPVILAEMGVTS